MSTVSYRPIAAVRVLVAANVCFAAGGPQFGQCERFAAGHQTAYDSVTCADPKAVTRVTAAVRFRGVGSYRTEGRFSSCLIGSADPLQITALWSKLPSTSD